MKQVFHAYRFQVRILTYFQYFKRNLLKFSRLFIKWFQNCHAYFSTFETNGKKYISINESTLKKIVICQI